MSDFSIVVHRQGADRWNGTSSNNCCPPVPPSFPVSPSFRPSCTDLLALLDTCRTISHVQPTVQVVLHPYCTVTCTATRQYFSTVMLQYYCNIFCYFTTVLLQYYCTVLYCCTVTVLLYYYSNTVLQYYCCTIVLLFCCTLLL